MFKSKSPSSTIFCSLILLCLVLFFLKMCEAPKSSSTIQVETAARQAVLAKLPYPETAKFREQKGYCGEVSYRAFNGVDVGYRRFIADSGNHVMIDMADSRMEFGLVWGNTCI